MNRRMAALGVIAVAAVACADSGGGPTAASVDVVVRDYEVDAPARIDAGPQRRLVVHNEGPTVHELVLIRTEVAPGQLPLGTDGVTADEERLAPIAANEYIGVDEDGPLVADLDPGRYVLFCNLPGHYQAGMRAGFVAT